MEDLPYQELKSIAAEAMVDVRTLRKAIAGQRVRDMARKRIVRALENRGYSVTCEKITRIILHRPS